MKYKQKRQGSLLSLIYESYVLYWIYITLRIKQVVFLWLWLFKYNFQYILTRIRTGTVHKHKKHEWIDDDKKIVYAPYGYCSTTTYTTTTTHKKYFINKYYCFNHEKNMFWRGKRYNNIFAWLDLNGSRWTSVKEKRREETSSGWTFLN